MPIPDTLARKITADFRAEKSMGAENFFVTLWLFLLLSNTMRPEQNGCHYAGNIFKCILLKDDFGILIWISLSLVSEGPADDELSLVQVMASCRTVNNPLPEPKRAWGESKLNTYIMCIVLFITYSTISLTYLRMWILPGPLVRKNRSPAWFQLISLTSNLNCSSARILCDLVSMKVTRSSLLPTAIPCPSGAQQMLMFSPKMASNIEFWYIVVQYNKILIYSMK